jgi:hypothetical protein
VGFGLCFLRVFSTDAGGVDDLRARMINAVASVTPDTLENPWREI